MWKASGTLDTDCAVFYNNKNRISSCTTPNSDVLFSMMVTLQKKTSWGGSKSLWGDKEAWNALVCGFMLQFLISISYIRGSNLQFRCDKRGVCTWVWWCLGWWSVIWSPEMCGPSWCCMHLDQNQTAQLIKVSIFCWMTLELRLDLKAAIAIW